MTGIINISLVRIYVLYFKGILLDISRTNGYIIHEAYIQTQEVEDK